MTDMLTVGSVRVTLMTDMLTVLTVGSVRGTSVQRTAKWMFPSVKCSKCWLQSTSQPSYLATDYCVVPAANEIQELVL